MRDLGLDYATLPVTELRAFHRNPRRGDRAAIAASLTAHGQYKPIVVNRGTITGRANEVLAGNNTLAAARQLGWPTLHCALVDVDDEQAARIVAADNRTSDLAGYDDQILGELLADLPDLDGTGYTSTDLDALLTDTSAPVIAPYEQMRAGALAERFLIPPMSVLDARQGWWQHRKRSWLDLGIRGEETRETAEVSGGGLKDAAARIGDSLGGVSIFDPVLCELVYRWFSPPAGRVLDPFAGGSVRGIVAAALGRRYTGIDLRPDQVAVNQDNAAEIITEGPRPWWVTGDATALDELDVGEADLVFSCPPYADLEVYSNNPRDLSTMDYAAFRAAHARAIQLACDRLRPDSWAVWVIGEARNGSGGFYGLVADTVHAFLDTGMTFATEAVLVTQVGTGSIRAGRMFTGTRSLCRSHQNVLVFCKGNRNRAAKRLGEVDVTALAELFESTTDTSP